MTAATVKGWCPSLHEPMAALDGLIVRVKPFVRGLSATDLELIAEAAERVGAGGLELTGRGALQVRGLDEAGAARFARAMVEAGLASADAAVERRRNLQLGMGCGPNLLSVAAGLEAWLEADARLSSLPAKFGFGVSPAEGMAADIVVVGEDEGYIVIGGEATIRVGVQFLFPPSSGLSRGPSHPEHRRLTARRRRGTERSALGTSPEGGESGGGWREGEGAEVVDAVQRLTHAFLTLAPLQPARPRRMKGLIQAIGAAAVLAEAGLAQAIINAGTSPPPLRRGGEVPQAGPGYHGFGLGVVFGVLSPSALRTAADLATRYGDGQILLAPNRTLWLSGVPASAQAQFASQASAAGFVVDPHDRRLRLDACVGAAGCARASEDVRAAALRLASTAPETGLHVSGCAKGCAHPGRAGVTLVSRGAPGRYDLILDGPPSAPPTLDDVSLDAIADHLSEPAL
jgi:precorrin-3B synthase